MIANLVTTLLLALGVATGNVSSNSYKGGNAFNHVEKLQEKPKKNQINQEITNAYFYQAQTLNVTLNGNRTETLRKYYIEKESNQNSVYTTDVYNIANTTYFLMHDQSSGVTQYYLTSIFVITTYFNFTSEEITLSQKCGLYNRTAQNVLFEYETGSYDQRPYLQDFIDLNLTASTPRIVWDNLILDKAQQHNYTHTEYSKTASSLTDTLVNTKTLTNLQANTKYYVFMYTQVAMQGNNQGNWQGVITPNTISFNGYSQITTLNYEVVDIPNLMFTILTLPFAWYSTAFNLTIFPNTPYALNFGNLILTIVAALILLYLIKKVIK